MNSRLFSSLFLATLVLCFDSYFCFDKFDRDYYEVDTLEVDYFIVPYGTTSEENGTNSYYEELYEDEYDMVDKLYNETAYNLTKYGKDSIIKAKVSLYMESLCPGCHEFVKSQLFPVFMKFPQYIQLDMIPYGNARHYNDSTGKFIFQCQHGQPECFGNMYLACLTHYIQPTRPKHLLRYYKCMADAQSFSIEKDVKDCAIEAYVNWHRLERCVRKEGPKLLAQYGDRTHALVGRKFVPTVVVDDKFNIDDQDEIDSDLLGYLCKRFKGRKPEECKNKTSQHRATKNKTLQHLRSAVEKFRPPSDSNETVLPSKE